MNGRVKFIELVKSSKTVHFRFGVKSVVPMNVVIGENGQSLNVKLDSSNLTVKI